MIVDYDEGDDLVTLSDGQADHEVPQGRCDLFSYNFYSICLRFPCYHNLVVTL